MGRGEWESWVGVQDPILNPNPEPSSSLLLSSLELSDTKVYAPQRRALLGTLNPKPQTLNPEPGFTQLPELANGAAFAYKVPPPHLLISSLLLPSLELSDTEVYEP